VTPRRPPQPLADPPALAGVDDVPWRQLATAYGSGRRVPDLLRGLWDPARAEHCADELLNSLYHQGGGYPGGAAALPFLAGAARAPEVTVRLEVLELVGRIAAEAPDAWPGLLPPLLGLLDDADPRVRAAAAGVVAGTAPDADGVAAALRARFAVEPEVPARVALLRGLAAMARESRVSDVPAAVAWLAEVAADDALAPLPELTRRYAARDASPLDVPDLVARVRRADWRALDAELVTWAHVLNEVGHLVADVPGARRDLAVHLLDDAAGEVRAAAAGSLGQALVASRAGQAEVAARLAAGVRDPDRDVCRISVHLCGCLGDVRPALPPGLADDLAALLGDSADHGRREPVADLAAWALARLGDPRCVPYLRRALETGGEPFGLFQSYFPADAYLVDLPGIVAVAGLVPGLAPDLLPALIRGLESATAYHHRRAYAQVVTAWGPAGAPAAGALAALLGTDAREWAAEALGAVGPAAAETLPGLATALAKATRWRPGRADTRLSAAAAHHAVTGDPGLALKVLPPSLTTERAETAARHLAAVGPPARAHLDRLRKVAGDGDPRVRVAGAYAVARVSGEPIQDVVSDLVDEALRGEAHPILADAVRDLAACGTPATARPRLAAMLATDRRICSAGASQAFTEDEALRRDAARALDR
jgi:hypothetical protein